MLLAELGRGTGPGLAWVDYFTSVFLCCKVLIQCVYFT